MNIQLAQKVVNQWRLFVEKKREVRSILVTQYKQSYLKVYYSYKEFKKRKFQQYIITNASKLIYKALKINLQRVQNLKQFIQQNKIKRFYILKQQDNLFCKITNLQSQNAIIKTIRPPKYAKCEHKNLIPLIFRSVKNAVILFNFHYMQKYYGETTMDKDMIKNEFLYYFTNYVTVKRPQKLYQLTAPEYERYKHVLQKVDKFQSEEYTLLNYVELQNINVLKKIYIHNRKNKDQQLQLYFDYQLKEIGAACKIQKFFRGKKNRKRKGMTYSVIVGLINQSRAIFVIQKWFRRIRQFHRTNFFKDISFYISQIPTEHLYLDMEIYQKIEQIVQDQQYTIKFLEQYNTIVSDNEAVRLTFLSSKAQSLNQSTYQQSISQFDNAPIKVVPQWLIKQIQMVPISQQKFIDYSIIKQEMKGSKWSCRNRQYQKKQFEKLNDLTFQKQCDIYGLLHLGAKISFDHICKRSYIRFTYKSTSEARYRALALALITYKFKYNGVSIQMLNDNLWESPYQKQEQFLQKYYYKIQKAFKIESLELASSNLQNSPSNCLILCKNEFQAEQFKLKQNEIQLQFYNETSKIPLSFIWMSTQQIIKKVPIKIQNQQLSQNNTLKLSSILQKSSILENRNDNEEDQQFEQSIQSKFYVSNELSPTSPKREAINKSTILALKFSILCLDNPDVQFQEPKFKRRTEQTYLEFAMTSRQRTQNNPLNNSKANGLYNFQSNNAQLQKKKNNQDLENISENTEYSHLQRRYKEFIQNENKTKGESIKSQKQNEKILLSEFSNLINKKGIKVKNNIIQTQRAKSIDRPTKNNIYSQYSQSVTKREDYKDYSLAFPKIEQKSSKKQNLDSRLSNYQKCCNFPEDQYTMAKDTIKF
ncbi:unnamed protein product (macronuclear) [Paramecium tetraurelia]|uniref:IQ calmodulin-binding motif family protein n=1 Tax=Paramecium tetraurelia TaxID=5888 RepID=A0DYH1_PARTE|nr:uncharacterized protein GSPATT00003056001 [Paramecium tetraurelia]CAK88088.1 unnamed protein product [Paramecium tetraurelia]|eukprot:XP_001455485.1 hypothetical protein (macronuclear) [Paramecium tetraurelia strain d4-2]